MFNEESWIPRSVDALVASARVADWPVEVIVVDDGSSDGTPERLTELQRTHGITVVSQLNRGRFEARKTGMAKASGEWIMLLDSRVIVDESSLVFLHDQVKNHPERAVWNGHINVASEHNPYAGFMAGLVKMPWRRYCANPRLMSFGIDEFDVFPKGTTLFVARKAMFEGSVTGFSSLFDDVRFASDDTRMLRWIAEREQIFIAPGLSATYHGRESFKKFVSQSYFRGTTYVDSYLESAGPARNALFGALAVGVAGLAIAAKRPRTALVTGVLGSAVVGAAVKRCGATNAEARAVTSLLPVFAAGFGTGLVRGLLLALRSWLRR